MKYFYTDHKGKLRFTRGNFVRWEWKLGKHQDDDTVWAVFATGKAHRGTLMVADYMFTFTTRAHLPALPPKPNRFS